MKQGWSVQTRPWKLALALLSVVLIIGIAIIYVLHPFVAVDFRRARVFGALVALLAGIAWWWLVWRRSPQAMMLGLRQRGLPRRRLRGVRLRADSPHQPSQAMRSSSRVRLGIPRST
jgi:membrane protease YdiL (CAAX protease family)